jgi:hypothetical protein
MSAIKDGRYPITLDKERHMLFSLNALDAIQDKFGGFDKLNEIVRGKDNLKNITWLMTLLLNEGAEDNEEPLTEKKVGRLVYGGNFNYVVEEMMKAFNFGNSGSTEPELTEEEPDDEEDDEKNAMSGQV